MPPFYSFIFLSVIPNTICGGAEVIPDHPMLFYRVKYRMGCQNQKINIQEGSDIPAIPWKIVWKSEPFKPDSIVCLDQPNACFVFVIGKGVFDKMPIKTGW